MHAMFRHERVTEHRGSDDLLTAGLGLAGLRNPAPPAFADPDRPTAAELRRRALWTAWRGIADLSAGGGYGEVYGRTDDVPGREYSALATLPGARHPHRVVVQVPDALDLRRRCVVVSPSSGSRGVYGAIAVAGPWALPRGCATVYTDKGTGSDYFDRRSGEGVRADGRLGGADEDLAFVPEPADAGGDGLAFKHAHSGDNPEADWGRHVKQAAWYALQALDRAYPHAAPFTFANTRVIAVGISNGGAAVLRAAERENGAWLDAVVAGEPNVCVDGARPMYDYATEAALLMPCALLHAPLGATSPPAINGITPAQFCRYARERGWIDGDTLQAQAQSAYQRLRAGGWTDEGLRAGAMTTALDLWRTLAVAYASAYGRYAEDAHPTGHRYVAEVPAPTPEDPSATRAPALRERATWWCDASGIPPGFGAALHEPAPDDIDSRLESLRRLRGLWGEESGHDAAVEAVDDNPENDKGHTTHRRRVRSGIEQTRAGPPPATLPILVVHGLDDGLIPPAFSSAPYVRAARASHARLGYWQVRNVQHFDAFLSLPGYATRYLPLLPYVYAALDRIQAHLDIGTALPVDAVIATTPRSAGEPLRADHLAIPR